MQEKKVSSSNNAPYSETVSPSISKLPIRSFGFLARTKGDDGNKLHTNEARAADKNPGCREKTILTTNTNEIYCLNWRYGTVRATETPGPFVRLPFFMLILAAPHLGGS